MNGKGTMLIVFAWLMENVGVTGGIVNSTYTTFGENLANTLYVCRLSSGGTTTATALQTRNHHCDV